MPYIADCVPLFSDTYLCDILNDEFEIILTLTTEVAGSAVAVYYGDKTAREKVESFSDREAFLKSLEWLVKSLSMPKELRSFAIEQLVFARSDKRPPKFDGTVANILKENLHC